MFVFVCVCVCVCACVPLKSCKIDHFFKLKASINTMYILYGLLDKFAVI